VSYRGLVLPPPAAARVDAGVRDLPLALVGANEPLEAARPLRLVDRSGRELGLALADPENQCLRVMVRIGEPFDSIGPSLLATRVERAFALRRALGLTGERCAWRAIHGAGDGLPGFTADVLAPWAVVYVYSRAFVPHGQEIAKALVAQAGLRGCVVKVRSRGAASQGRVRQEIVGDPPPAALVVEERGVPFEVHLERGLNTGLFTDMREHRHALPRIAAGKRVLNGFSYTGTLSVLAARGGALSVTSVDLSGGVQAWAQDNFRLSGLDPAAHRFETDDVSRFLDRALSESRGYDLVLLDPPAFSAARGAEFALDSDYPDLIAKAARLVPTGGLLWLACNARETVLLDLVARGLASPGRGYALLEQGGLPADHPTVPAQQRDRYLQLALLALE
jgi:23S rRNA (cytosine1962-C5)-methyltransferase